jgi:hypothetical protein
MPVTERLTLTWPLDTTEVVYTAAGITATNTRLAVVKDHHILLLLLVEAGLFFHCLPLHWHLLAGC